MGTVPQKVLNWLHGALRSVRYPDTQILSSGFLGLNGYQEYRNVPRTYSDVAQTLSYNPNFTLRTDVYSME